MLDRALRPPPQLIIWNDIFPSSHFSSGPPGHISLEVYSSGNQSCGLDTSTSSSAGGSLSGSPTLDSIFFTSSEEREDLRTFRSVSETTRKPQKRKTVACRSCRQRKIKCERNENVWRRKQQRRSAPLTHDQGHDAPSVSELKLKEELDATKLALFREEEKFKVMSATIARLEEDKRGLLERLGHPPGQGERMLCMPRTF